MGSFRGRSLCVFGIFGGVSGRLVGCLVILESEVYILHPSGFEWSTLFTIYGICIYLYLSKLKANNDKASKQIDFW